MFLWVVLLILTGFLIGKKSPFDLFIPDSILGHHFFHSGSIVNHVSSPEEENQAAEMLMRSQKVQVVS